MTNTFKDMIITYPHNILYTPTTPFDFTNPPGDPNELATLMMQVMNESNAVGLSANQLGIPYSVMVMRGDPHNYACFNPRLVYTSPEVEEAEEGCLSFPDVNLKIKRHKEDRKSTRLNSSH